MYHYVYILQSLTDNDRYYCGITNDLKRRLEEHNNGNSIHTNKFKPWHLQTYMAFDNQEKAFQFEAYLKTASGRAFSKKRF